jgi:FixJ family two-component response regulator
VLDIRLSGVNRLESQDALSKADIHTIVFMTADDEISMSVKAIKAGAINPRPS